MKRSGRRKTKGKPKGKPRGRKGRRPTGIHPGERLRDYKQLTIRLPPPTLTKLQRLVEQLSRPQWRVIVDAIEAYADSQPTRYEETPESGRRPETA